MWRIPIALRARRYALSAACVALLIRICYSAAHVNATTAALSMLVLVLGIATHWGLGEAIFTSIACVLGFNYYFLPPVGKFTIADPQNWVALCAFLISAAIASQLSSRAKTRAEEASARRSEIERLYRLSRAMLMDETTDISRTALLPACEIFGLRQIAFFDADSRQIFGSTEDSVLSEAELARVAAANEPAVGDGFAMVPVTLGSHVIGSVGLAGRDLSQPEREAIANLIAIAYERARAIDRATAAEAARRGERMKTFLLDGIAHDLKTPLTAIKTCVTALITIPPRTEEKRAELLSIIDEETDRLQRTITEAIQLARIESGKIALDKRVLRPLDIAVRALNASAGREGDRVSIPVDLSVEADPGLLEQAIRQVVENARKYAPASGSLEIAARRDNGSLLFEVLDRGPGISPGELDRIFEKFYRGTRGRGAVEGTGMGLAIAKGIIEAHGGAIWAENRPGGGAIFSFRIPLHEHDDDSGN